MLVRSRILGVVGVLAVIAGAAPAFATAIPVGTGASHADVYVEFQDGANYVFDVAFDGSPSGLGLFDIIEAGQPLTTIRQNFGWGDYIDGIAFDGHSNSGYGGGENWWHYLTNDGAGWTSPPFGAADRIVANGSADRWVYGSAPEPATAGLLIAGALLAIGGRRSRRSR